MVKECLLAREPPVKITIIMFRNLIIYTCTCTVYIKQFLHSDWLREMQFSGNKDSAGKRFSVQNKLQCNKPSIQIGQRLRKATGSQ